MANRGLNSEFLHYASLHEGDIVTADTFVGLDEFSGWDREAIRNGLSYLARDNTTATERLRRGVYRLSVQPPSEDDVQDSTRYWESVTQIGRIHLTRCDEGQHWLTVPISHPTTASILAEES